MGICASTTKKKMGVLPKHRHAVTARTEDGRHVRVPVIAKPEESKQRIKDAVRGNLLFEHMDAKAIQAVVDSATKLKANAGDVIIAQGDLQADTFYVVESGECRVYKKDATGKQKPLHTVYRPGTGFGELALLYDAPRAATVRAIKPTRLWIIRRDVLLAIKRRASDLESKEKAQAVNDSECFSVLSKEQKSKLVDALRHVEFRVGDVVEDEETFGQKLYLILRGALAISRGGIQVAKKGPGGLMGLEVPAGGNGRPRLEATMEGTRCLVIANEEFLELVGPLEYVWQYEILRKLPILSSLQASQLAKLARELQSVEYHAGELVYAEGDRGTSFYIIRYGTVSVANEGRIRAYLGEKSSFGEHGLLNEQARINTVRAVERTALLELTREALSSVVGSLAQVKQERRTNILCNVPLFSSLPYKQLAAIAKAMETVICKDGASIVERGEIADAFFIIETGEAAVLNGDEEIQRLHPGDYFGELALMRNEVRRATVKAIGEVVVHRGGRQLFDRLLSPLKSTLEQNASKYQAFAPQRPIVSLQDLHQVACLGVGSFGKVLLVKYSGKAYALKIMSKHKIVGMNLQRHLLREKQVLEECLSPFIVNLVAHFQDEGHVYFMMDLALGGDFFTHLRANRKPVTEDAARFYVGCVVLALEYLHARNIAFRDLKPENLLLEENGYLKLADFGFAKNIKSGKSYTMCGTPEYLAPELVLQSGHNQAVDWWAVGILLYEILCGRTPFADTQSRMFRKICDATPKFPKEVSAPARDLMRKLLSPVPATRLGMLRGGVQDIKKHPWFAGFDWNGLQRRQLSPPYTPPLRGSGDYSMLDVLPLNTPVPGDGIRLHPTKTLADEVFHQF